MCVRRTYTAHIKEVQFSEWLSCAPIVRYIVRAFVCVYIYIYTYTPYSFYIRFLSPIALFRVYYCGGVVYMYAEWNRPRDHRDRYRGPRQRSRKIIICKKGFFPYTPPGYTLTYTNANTRVFISYKNVLNNIYLYIYIYRLKVFNIIALADIILRGKKSSPHLLSCSTRVSKSIIIFILIHIIINI